MRSGNRMEWNGMEKKEQHPMLTLPGFRRVEMNQHSPTHSGHSSLTESFPLALFQVLLIPHPTKLANETAPSRLASLKPDRFHIGLLGGRNFSISTQPISLFIGFQLNCIPSCSCSRMGPCERVLVNGTRMEVRVPLQGQAR